MQIQHRCINDHWRAANIFTCLALAYQTLSAKRNTCAQIQHKCIYDYWRTASNNTCVAFACNTVFTCTALLHAYTT